jgi:hypothetical protein
LYTLNLDEETQILKLELRFLFRLQDEQNEGGLVWHICKLMVRMVVVSGVSKEDGELLL